jgi:hypothetical protein
MSAMWESARLAEIVKLVENRAHNIQHQGTASQRKHAEKQLERDLAYLKKEALHQRKCAKAQLEVVAQGRRKTFLQEQFALSKDVAEADAHGKITLAEAAAKDNYDENVASKLRTSIADTTARENAILDAEAAMTSLKVTHGRYAVWEKRSLDIHNLSSTISILNKQLQRGEPIDTALKAAIKNPMTADVSGRVVRAAAEMLTAAGAGEGFPTRSQLRDNFENSVKSAARIALYVPLNYKGATGQAIGRVRAVAPGTFPSLPTLGIFDTEGMCGAMIFLETDVCFQTKMIIHLFF